MIFTIDDLSDENERKADRRQRATHDRDLALSPASGSWWRAALGADEEIDDEDALAPDASSMHRRNASLPDNTPAFRARPAPTWKRDR